MEKIQLAEAFLLFNGVLEGLLGQTEKKLKKKQKDYQYFGLRNAVYYEGWEFVSYWDGCHGEFG